MQKLANDPECRVKLNRAFKHLKSVDERTMWWVEKYRVTHDDDADEQGAKIVRLHAPPAPTELGLLVGECLHNARSFLDNLAFHLAATHSGAQFTDAMQQTSEFPIFFARPPTDNEIERKIGGVHPDAQEIIRALQPHNAADYRQNPLFHLHELDRINKHRFLLPAAAGHMGTGVGLPGMVTRIDWLVPLGDPMVGPSGYAEICRYKGWHMIAGQKRMDVPLKIDKAAVFATGPFRGFSVTPVLQGILDHIRDNVVAPLESFF